MPMDTAMLKAQKPVCLDSGMPLLTNVVQKPIPAFVDAMEHATQLQMLAQKQSTIGQINQIQEQMETTLDAEFVNQIQQGYHNNRGNNRGNSRGRGNRGQSRGNRNRRNRGHFFGGYYSNKPTGNCNGNGGGNNQNKEAPKLNTKVNVCSATSLVIIKTTAVNVLTPANHARRPQEWNTFPNLKCIQ